MSLKANFLELTKINENKVYWISEKIAKIIRAIYVKTVHNIEPKSSSQMSGRGSGFLVLGLESWILDPAWVSAPGSWALDLEFQVLGLGFIQWLLQSVRKNYYKVWQSLRSVTESCYKGRQELQIVKENY